MPKVLVVDDEPAIVEVLQTFLTRNGHTVRTAFDGPTALQSVQADRPDVVLLDLRMPGMSGLEVLRCIREIDQELKVIILSGILDEETRQQVLDLGAHACLPKPVDPRVLERFLMGGNLVNGPTGGLAARPSAHPVGGPLVAGDRGSHAEQGEPDGRTA